MKSVIIIIAVIVLSINAANAQKVKETEVPKTVITSFQTHFGGVRADAWDKEKNGEYEAEFKMNKVEMSANFSSEGTLIETEEEIAITSLLNSVEEYINKNYLGSKIEEASKITDAAGKITYETEIEKGKEEIELIFDANGQFVKKMIEVKDEKHKD